MGTIPTGLHSHGRYVQNKYSHTGPMQGIYNERSAIICSYYSGMDIKATRMFLWPNITVGTMAVDLHSHRKHVRNKYSYTRCMQGMYNERDAMICD